MVSDLQSLVEAQYLDHQYFVIFCVLEVRRVGPLREIQSPTSLLGLGAAKLGGNRPRW